MPNIDSTGARVAAGAATGIGTVLVVCAASALARKILGKSPRLFTPRALVVGSLTAVVTGTAVALSLPRKAKKETTEQPSASQGGEVSQVNASRSDTVTSSGSKGSSAKPTSTHSNPSTTASESSQSSSLAPTDSSETCSTESPESDAPERRFVDLKEITTMFNLNVTDAERGAYKAAIEDEELFVHKEGSSKAEVLSLKGIPGSGEGHILRSSDGEIWYIQGPPNLERTQLLEGIGDGKGRRPGFDSAPLSRIYIKRSSETDPIVFDEPFGYCLHVDRCWIHEGKPRLAYSVEGRAEEVVYDLIDGIQGDPLRNVAVGNVRIHVGRRDLRVTDARTGKELASWKLEWGTHPLVGAQRLECRGKQAVVAWNRNGDIWIAEEKHLKEKSNPIHIATELPLNRGSLFALDPKKKDRLIIAAGERLTMPVYEYDWRRGKYKVVDGKFKPDVVAAATVPATTLYVYDLKKKSEHQSTPIGSGELVGAQKLVSCGKPAAAVWNKEGEIWITDEQTLGLALGLKSKSMHIETKLPLNGRSTFLLDPNDKNRLLIVTSKPVPSEPPEKKPDATAGSSSSEPEDEVASDGEEELEELATHLFVYDLKEQSILEEHLVFDGETKIHKISLNEAGTVNLRYGRDKVAMVQLNGS